MKITFLGAGSTIFIKNVIGDCMLTDSLRGTEYCLYDIDTTRLRQSKELVEILRNRYDHSARITACSSLSTALCNSKYVINAISVGSYNPYIISDFEIPQKYGLYQTVADTLGIGGLFRGLRTIPVVINIAHKMEHICPDALFINYTNPMAIVTGALLHNTSIKTIGLCHSVQRCVPQLLSDLDISSDRVISNIAGINHQAWLLAISRDGHDIYPEIRKQAILKFEENNDKVRYEMMRVFGYYLTESSSHASEYLPYYHKNRYPSMTSKYNIPTDGYKTWAYHKNEYWEEISDKIKQDSIFHERSEEYVSYIIDAMESNRLYEFAGNVSNRESFITNLPQNACVEVQCTVSGLGCFPHTVGSLPEQCAAINRTNINMQLLTIEAAISHKREAIYHAALLDPHASAELSIDDIISICDELILINKDTICVR